MNNAELEGAVILIADDHPENLGVLFECFYQLGCTVLVCESGEDALEITTETTPDIILLDILMPGLDGFETCRRLKANEKTGEIPVLFVSSLNETVDKVRAFELGGVDFINKPFQTEEVLARVSAHLGYHKLKRELEQKNRRLEEEIRQHELTEQHLQKARDLANSANRAKSVFLSNMSHELRTPLHGVLGYTQLLLKDETLSQRQQDALKTIRQSGEHLLTLINEILEFSKIETKKIELDIRPFRLPELLYSIADTIRRLAFQKGLRFLVDISPDLPLVVDADRQRIRQVLLNILQNAVKFTERGSIEFRAQMRPWTKQAARPEQKLSIHFEIVDSGIGISPEQLPEIFEPFKSSGDQYTQTEGAGLSLAVSRHLIRMMGGEILVKSTRGEGTVVYIDLDLVENRSGDIFDELEEEPFAIQNAHDIETPEVQFALPSDEELAILQKYVLIGDIMAVRNWAGTMRASHETIQPFVEEIDRLAQNFNIGGIQRFLEELDAEE